VVHGHSQLWEVAVPLSGTFSDKWSFAALLHTTFSYNPVRTGNISDKIRSDRTSSVFFAAVTAEAR